MGRGNLTQGPQLEQCDAVRNLDRVCHLSGVQFSQDALKTSGKFGDRPPRQTATFGARLQRGIAGRGLRKPVRAAVGADFLGDGHRLSRAFRRGGDNDFRHQNLNIGGNASGPRQSGLDIGIGDDNAPAKAVADVFAPCDVRDDVVANGFFGDAFFAQGGDKLRIGLACAACEILKRGVDAGFGQLKPYRGQMHVAQHIIDQLFAGLFGQVALGAKHLKQLGPLTDFIVGDGLFVDRNCRREKPLRQRRKWCHQCCRDQRFCQQTHVCPLFNSYRPDVRQPRLPRSRTPTGQTTGHNRSMARQ